MRERGLKRPRWRYQGADEQVAPHAGAWVETLTPAMLSLTHVPSLPMRERGLKLTL